MTQPRAQYVISIMSRDHLGIIYEVARALSDLDGNIADVRQSVLSGYFTMILLASFPAGVTQRAIERKLAEADANSETALQASVRRADEVAHTGAPAAPRNTYVLTATGADRVGIVASVAEFCVRHRLNIIDLSTATSDGAYVMILIVDPQGSASIQDVRVDLQRFALESGLTAALQHHDIFRAVNEINLPLP